MNLKYISKLKQKNEKFVMMVKEYLSFNQKIYLSIYNGISFFGWFHLFLLFLQHSFDKGLIETCKYFFVQNRNEILILQYINLFDVLHAYLGLWGASDISMWK